MPSGARLALTSVACDGEKDLLPSQDSKECRDPEYLGFVLPYSQFSLHRYHLQPHVRIAFAVPSRCFHTRASPNRQMLIPSKKSGGRGRSSAELGRTGSVGRRWAESGAIVD